MAGHRLDDVGQLQAQQQKDQTVEGELQQRPDAAVEQARAGLARQQVEPALHHPRRHRRENAGNAQALGQHISGKRQQQHEHHVSGRVVPAAGDHPGAQAPDQPAQGHTNGQAADSDQNKGQAGLSEGEHPGDRRRQGELEGHQARGIVHQRLALEHVHQGRRQAVLGDGRDRYGVGRRQHRGQGKGHRQRNAGQDPVNEIAGTDHSKQHQADRQGQNRAAQPPEVTLGHPPAIGKQQRRQEQKQKQFRVQGHVQAQGRPCQQGAGGNLHQRQGQRDHPPDQFGNTHQHQQDENGVG